MGSDPTQSYLASCVPFRVVARDQPYLFTVQVATKWALSARVKNAEVSQGFGL